MNQPLSSASKPEESSDESSKKGDHDLVRRVQSGDSAAFRVLFDKYHRRAFAVAMGVVDAYAISRIFPWDQAGGTAACLALGYELKCWDGTPWDLTHHDIVVSRPGMWPTIAPMLKAAW